MHVLGAAFCSERQAPAGCTEGVMTVEFIKAFYFLICPENGRTTRYVDVVGIGKLLIFYLLFLTITVSFIPLISVVLTTRRCQDKEYH